MAEERNVGLARAQEPPVTDEDTTKAELQRRMEEARESITQTVSEIKDTVTTQYEHVRETISESLDWREQFRRRPVEFSAGALGLGLLLGYGLGGAFVGRRDRSDDDDYSHDYTEYDDDDDSDSDVRPAMQSMSAARPITGGVSASSPYGSSTDYNRSSASLAPAASYEGSYKAMADAETGVDKPSLLNRFKETKAYDRLQSELSTLGDRFVEELSGTARTVVLPALLGKVKDMIGIDLSTQREVAQRSKLEQQTAGSRADAESTTDQQTGGPANPTGNKRG
ncbi:MAG: hypothetical protein H0W76_14000 [Pyrinomonadaceae bacterium]|nr:hypothetical protein [Pyrinomonadaceae bacterium]